MTVRPFPRSRVGRFAVLALTAVLTLAGLPAAAAAPAPAGAATVRAVAPEPAAAPESRPAAAPESQPAARPVDYVRNCPARPDPGRYTCYSLHRTGRARFAPAPQGYGPADLIAAYALPAQPAGAVPTVYVIDAFGYPNAQSDLARYRQQYSLPACTVANGCLRILNQRGGTSPLPEYDQGWAEETALDLDMVSAVCPACHITLIQADDNSDNLFRAVDRANALGAVYLSMSWGGPEDGTESRYDSAYFNRTGVVYAASSGDGGFGAGPSYPSTSGNVVAVGGTSLLPTGSGGRGWSETVWGGLTATNGTGSACSSDEAKPSWQGVVAGSVCTRRAGNDVAAVADPDTGVAVYQTGPAGGGWSVAGGTSASAPIIAGVYALAGRPGSQDHPASYPYTQVDQVNDVTSGTNGYCDSGVLCTAGAGWDGPTGVGTPKGVSAFDPPSRVIRLGNPDNQLSPVGTPVRLVVPVTETGGTPVVTATGLPAGLTISSSGVVTGTPTTLGLSSVVVTARDGTAASSVVRFGWNVRQAGTYLSVPAQRLVNTQRGIGAPAGLLPGNHSLPVQVLGRGGVPSTGVSAVVVTLTVAQPAAAGYAALYADGRSAPGTSNLNFAKGQSVSNLAVVKLGTGGRIRLFTGSTANYVIDVTGYYVAGSPVAKGAVAVLDPVRIFDTRTGSGVQAGVVADRTARTVQIAGRGGVPASGASAVLLNLSALDTVRAGWVSAYPNPRARPATSNVDFPAHAVVAGLVVVPLNTDGTITMFVSGGADLIGDVFGYVKAGSPAVAGGVVALTASRLLDTRNGTGVGGRPITVVGGDTLSLKVTGHGGIPASGVSAVLLTVAVAGPTAGGYLIVHPDDVQVPGTSNLNYARGQTLADLVMVPVSAQGYVALTVSRGGSTALLADVAGYVVGGP